MAATKNADDMSSVTVSAQRMGDILGVGDRMVRYLAEEGVLKRNSHGKYLLVASVKNYILTLKISKPTSVETEKNEGPLSWEDEKAKHEKLKRQITDLKLQILKGRLHKSEDVERVVNDMLAKFKSKMEAMPAKLARKLEKKSKTQILEILQDEIRSALEELSEYNPSDYYSDDYIEIEDDYIYKLGDEKDEEEP